MSTHGMRRTATALASAAIVLAFGSFAWADPVPDISVSPASLSEDLFTGGSVTRALRITNTGGSDLNYELAVRGVPAGRSTSPGTPLSGGYSGAALAFGITNYGEVMPFQHPVGNEHLAVGNWYSGYTLAYVANG